MVAAPTGVAAINAGGVTLHSLFRLPLHPFLPTHKSREDLLSKLRYNAEKRNLLCKMELLVIDAVSYTHLDVYKRQIYSYVRIKKQSSTDWQFG